MATNNMPDETQYFHGDVVYRVDRHGYVKFGVALKNDYQDMSDDSDEEIQRKKEEVRVVWYPSGVLKYVSLKKVHLTNRNLMPGDVVRRMIKGKDTQRGYCREIKSAACVQIIGTKKILTGIKSEDLTPLERFRANVAVCMDSWVGRIKVVNFKLHLATSDGSRCVISEADSHLATFEQKCDHDNNFPHSSEFYPGQCLRGPIQFFEDAEWIECTKEMIAKRKFKPQKRMKFIVEEVEIENISVNWQCCAYTKDGTWLDQTQPKSFVEGADLKKLKLLNILEPSTLQVGDRDFYVLKNDENILTYEQWRKQQKKIFQVPKHSLKKSRARKILEERLKQERDTIEKYQENDKDNGIEKLKGNSLDSSVQNNGTNDSLMPPPLNQSHNTDSSDEWDTENTESQSETESSSSDFYRLPPVGKKKRFSLKTKKLKKKKLVEAKKEIPPLPLIPGMKVFVEAMATYSKANVVWQDGSVELEIPSTQLYPIHHLDKQEFFPGDFVVDKKEESRIYGVVQSVDHQGRMAKIKWFRTYTSSQSPQPTLIEEREVSVYDLKDHPDFQYRPGTLVICIANFEGDNIGCTAGQVLDNYPEGRVKVWWVDGHISMCWPQDLYKVNEYESDEGEFWDEVSSDASWETQLEDCIITDTDGSEQTENIKPKLTIHIEKARIAMSRLEKIFTQNPALQTTEVMRELLEVYKDCRYMDKLMGTSFFHESNFQGLLERVRERGRANAAKRITNQATRLLKCQSVGSESGEDAGENANNTSIQNAAGALEKIATKINDTVVEAESNNLTEKIEIKNKNDNVFIDVKPHPEDSGLYSVENSDKKSGSSESSGEFPSSDDLNLNRSLVPEIIDHESEPTKSQETFLNSHVANSHVCVNLCTLIKAQLLLAHAEVSKRFGLGRMSLADAVKNETPQMKPNKEKECIELELDTSFKMSEIPLPEYMDGEGFSIDESAPNNHKFKLTMFQPTDPTNFFRAVSKELKILQSSLPAGIWVKGFEDRIDLYSVMFRGSKKTPYEDGLFLFDFQLSANHPAAPPFCHYISYCSDRLNPNLYEDGKVCVSLLGTWVGRNTELWTSSSTLLQLFVSIQGLILVSEPYFNEAGFEKQRNTQQGRENSRMYNEMVVLKLVQAQTKLLQHPPPVFKEIIIQYFKKQAKKLLQRLEMWIEISEHHNNQHQLSPLTPTSFKDFAQIDKKFLPEFPLIPASRGFCVTLRKILVTFKQTLVNEGILQDFKLSENPSDTSIIKSPDSKAETSKTS